MLAYDSNVVCLYKYIYIHRLTFWLSNSIVLRATLSRGIEKLNLVSIKLGSDEWEDPRAFLAALEKFESWIFSRVVKSVWWQVIKKTESFKIFVLKLFHQAFDLK